MGEQVAGVDAAGGSGGWHVLGVERRVELAECALIPGEGVADIEHVDDGCGGRRGNASARHLCWPGLVWWREQIAQRADRRLGTRESLFEPAQVSRDEFVAGVEIGCVENLGDVVDRACRDRGIGG